MKKSKKGFTLIELLAVIAILAILVVIAVPAVLDLFNNSKESAFRTQAQQIFKAAETQIVQDQINPTAQAITKYTNVVEENLNNGIKPLSLQGTTSVKYCVTISGNKISSMTISDKSYSFTIDNPTINSFDSSNPTDYLKTNGIDESYIAPTDFNNCPHQ